MNVLIGFQRLNIFGLKLNPAKCNLFQNSVKYLGHVISEDGIRTDPNNVHPLHDWPVPTTVKESHQCLGLTGYYRRFVQDYSKIAQPLNYLQKGKCSRNK